MAMSMTGFSSTTITLYPKDIKIDPVNLTITLKTLNSRYFESNLKLPYSLTHLETTLIKKLKLKLLRGSVFLAIHMNKGQSINSKIVPALGHVSQYIIALNNIKKEFNLEGEISLGDIIKLPNIFETQDQAIEPSIEKEVLLTIDKLIKKLLTVRKKEGTALKKDIQKRISAIENYLKKLKPQAELVAQNKKEEFFKNLEKINQYIKEAPDNPQSAGILSSQLDKIDIHEEITRLETHIISFSETLESKKEEKGRQLDFTLQEMFREINTICAKCSDNIISKLSINIKVELEKAREQAQNIV